MYIFLPQFLIGSFSSAGYHMIKLQKIVFSGLGMVMNMYTHILCMYAKNSKYIFWVNIYIYFRLYSITTLHLYTTIVCTERTVSTSMVGAAGRGRKLTAFSEEERRGWLVEATTLLFYQRELTTVRNLVILALYIRSPRIFLINPRELENFWAPSRHRHREMLIYSFHK